MTFSVAEGVEITAAELGASVVVLELVLVIEVSRTCVGTVLGPLATDDGGSLLPGVSVVITDDDVSTGSVFRDSDAKFAVSVAVTEKVFGNGRAVVFFAVCVPTVVEVWVSVMAGAAVDDVVVLDDDVDVGGTPVLAQRDPRAVGESSEVICDCFPRITM